MESANESIEVVDTACRQIANSQGLKDVLSCVLASGNLLNSGTNRANAQGIKMENLMKLSDVRVSVILKTLIHLSFFHVKMLIPSYTGKAHIA